MKKASLAILMRMFCFMPSWTAFGAMGKGDIGKLFPDTDDAYKDADSRLLLRRVHELMEEMDLP